jgi:hypothetical protein
MKTTKICPCEKEFEVYISGADRKKYCSKVCFYKYHGRRSGLKYNIVTDNKGWFKNGTVPWNKGIEGSYLAQWKGDNVSKDALHDWVERKLGKPNKCEKCGSSKNLQWSNKSEKYKRDITDWQRLCTKCHQRYDYENFNKRKAFYE